MRGKVIYIGVKKCEGAEGAEGVIGCRKQKKVIILLVVISVKYSSKS